MSSEIWFEINFGKFSERLLMVSNANCKPKSKKRDFVRELLLFRELYVVLGFKVSVGILWLSI